MVAANAATEIITAQTKTGRLIPGILWRTRLSGNATLDPSSAARAKGFVMCWNLCLRVT